MIQYIMKIKIRSKNMLDLKQQNISQQLYKAMSEYFRKYIKKQHYPNHPSNIKFKTSFKNCVYTALANRQWKQTYAQDWNMMWCQKQQIDWVFERHRMLANMRVNHFRGWYELCRKDMLNKNLKKYKRGLDKQNNKQQSSQYDFLPPTFLLPSEYIILSQQFKRQSDNKNLWIMKPTSKCQGKGIFIFNKIGDISRWKSFNKENPPEPYVCQRYLMNPLLLGGRKFDMRIYALCTSYNPLTIYLYRAGFARFAHDRYDNTDTENLYKHLTNVAININSPNYVKWIGGKWFLEQLKKYMFSKFGIQSANYSFHDIQRCIIKSLKAVQKLVTNCPQSFELYGFDFIFDSKGKAWLLQVNGGPSMTANTKEDDSLKVGLIDDTMTVIDLEGILKGDQELIGGFDLIYKNQEIGNNTTSMYTTMLGAKNNRQDNLKKLARATAFRLAKQFLEKGQSTTTKKIENKFNIKPMVKVERPKIPRSTVYNNEAKKTSINTEKAVSVSEKKVETEKNQKNQGGSVSQEKISMGKKKQEVQSHQQ